jgi:hypothetical protein
MATLTTPARRLQTVAELCDAVLPWYPLAYSWERRDAWVIYDGHDPSKVLGEGATEVEAWAAAANSMPPNS